MASSPAELASCLLNSDNSWLPSSEPANSKPQNNVDLSWLPNYNDKSFTNDSDDCNNQHVQSDSDDSWLPNYNDTKKKCSAPVSKSSNSNRCRKTEQDSDDSWLPSVPVVKNKTKNRENHYNDSRVPNCKKNSSLNSSKSLNLNRFRRTETSPDRSWLPTPPIVINGDKKKEISTSSSSNHHKKSSNHTFSGNQQTQNTRVSNKKPESSRSQGQVSPARSECSVETDSLGGVSTLLRRWKDVETKITSRKSKPSSCVNNNNNYNGIPSKVFDGAGRCGSSSATDESLVDSESCKFKNESFVGGNRCFPSVIGNKRLIRGRQAFIDFLSMVEQDKRRELESLRQRKPVSKFPNRGRIQALLRVRLIRIGAENQKEAKSHKHSVSRTMKSIWDKISTGAKQDTPASKKAEGLRKSNTTPECTLGGSTVRESTVTPAATTAANSQELGSAATSHQSTQEPNKDAHSDILLPDTADYQENTQHLSAKRYSSGIDEKALDYCIPVQSEMGLEHCHNWINECSQTRSEWDDDEEEEYYNYNYNWISDIARPRSDWEFMRQQRYQEMLNNINSYNQDIHQLLESKSVSGFLSSDQRNLLDQLMVSRAQGVSRTESRKEEEKYAEDEFTDQTACSSPPTQSPAPEQRSWNHDHHHHQHQHPHSNPYLQNYNNNNNNNNTQSSFINHPSIEMELIYDLRVHVVQIHQEITELRKAVTSCVNMQVKNQHQSIQKKRSEQVSTTRNCCVCYAVQADSFLYRCGHMCTCYDCGLELQCTSAKCPVCEDPILDVVRAYVYGD